MRTDTRFENPPGRRFDKPNEQRKVTFSIARLAAEAAFAPEPLPASSVHKPVVRVVPARVPAVNAGASEPQGMGVGSVDISPREPRVFRIGHATPSGVPGIYGAAEPERPPRRRGKANEATRPGPVLQIVAAQPAAPQNERNHAVANAQEGVGQLNGLRLALRALDPTFVDIEFAQSFDLLGGDSDQAWQQLDNALTALAVQLRQTSAT